MCLYRAKRFPGKRRGTFKASQGGKATAVQLQKTPAVPSVPEASPTLGGSSRPVSSTVQMEGAVSGLFHTPGHSKVNISAEHGVEQEGPGR